MVAARRATARIVDTLTDADRFAVLCFDNSVERVADASPGWPGQWICNRFRAIEQLALVNGPGWHRIASAARGRPPPSPTRPSRGSPRAS